jgi:hypothetical protein
VERWVYELYELSLQNSPSRNGFQNSTHHRTVLSDTDSAEKKKTRKLFTPREDEQIRRFVAQYGDSKWNQISRRLSGRSSRQCKERWFSYLAPHVVHSPWTEEDDQLLLSKIDEVGHNWKLLEMLFPGRSNISIKNHWRKLQGKVRPQPTTSQRKLPDLAVFDRLFETLMSEADNGCDADSPVSLFSFEMFW